MISTAAVNAIGCSLNSSSRKARYEANEAASYLYLIDEAALVTKYSGTLDCTLEIVIFAMYSLMKINICKNKLDLKTIKLLRHTHK